MLTEGVAFVLYPTLGQVATALTFIPVVLAGTVFGAATGAAVGAALALLDAAAMATLDVLPLDSRGLSQAVVGILGFTLLGGLAGRYRDLQARVADQSRLLESERAKLQRELGQRQEYTDVLAHEMRNPLVAIRAAARAASRDVADPNAARRLTAIGEEAARALGLLDSLSDVSSLEGGRMRTVLRPIDLAETVRETVRGLGEIGHPMRLDVPDAVLQVNADEKRVAQVVSNLITNAAKYSPPDAPIEVSAGLSADRSTAIVRVRDYGPGIPPAERERLFEKFARLSTAGGTSGSGLGLFISRGIVREHGGDLWAEFPPGGGTSFAMNLPAAQR